MSVRNLSPMDTELRTQIVSRARVVLFLMVSLAVCVGASVAWIHVEDASALRVEGYQQVETLETLPANRGAIIDSKGRPLVANMPRYEIAIDPTATGFESSEDAVLGRLASITGKPVGVLEDRIAARASSRYVAMFTLSEEQWVALDEANLPGVILTETSTRHYIHNETAAHVLGHVDPDGVGLAGLELQYDTLLAGTAGLRPLLRDRLGRRRADAAATIQEPVDGQSIVLTIDLVRQTILEEELHKGVKNANAARGTAIAMNPRTGAIISLANWPTFDPNNPNRYPPAHWRNYAVTDRMEPGSTFKLIPAIAALELGITTIDRPVKTGDGVAVFHGNTMRDTKARGTIPFSDVIAFSSNVGMARTAANLQPTDLYRYARNLGFGVKTWIDLPGEVTGQLKKPDLWSGTTPTSMSIGYEVDVTAIQILTAYAALANGGLLVQPHIVAEHRDPLGNTTWRAAQDPATVDSVRRAFTESTAKLLQPAFQAAVDKGTAQLAAVPGMTVAGKTGTSRKVVGGEYGPDHRATFVGYFPVERPEAVLIVVIDEPETSPFGGQVAAPVFGAIAERWRRLSPSSRAIHAPDSLILPDVRGLPLAAARRQLRAIGFSVLDTPDSAVPVTGQHPAPGTRSAADTRVQLRSGSVGVASIHRAQLDARAEIFALTAATVRAVPDVDSTATPIARHAAAVVRQ